MLTMRRNVSNPAGDSQKEHTFQLPPDLHKKRLLTLIVLLTLSLTSTLHAATITGRVERVIDGDTISVSCQSCSSCQKKKFHKIRLAEIDAPEMKTTHGPKAKAALSGMILHKTVVITWTRRGRYRRIIGQVYINGICINHAMVAQGWTRQFKKYSRDQDIAQAEQAARVTRAGLWAIPVPPLQ